MSKLKSQWEIVTRQAPAPRFDPGTKPVKPIDLTAKRKRPNGQMMTDLEWAQYAINRAKGATLYKSCRCHGKCGCV